MKNLLYLPLNLFYFYFECKKSPLQGIVFKWSALFSFLLRVRLHSIFYPNKRDVCLKFNDYTLHANDYTSLENLFNEIFVNGEYYFPKSNDITPKVIYDCGANIGFTMVFFKILFPDVKVVSFEPNPVAFYYLNKNISSNSFKNVYAYQLALSNINDEIELFFDRDNLATASLNQGRDIFDNSVKVKTVLLSDFVKSEDKIDILKIDVEGAEIDVFSDLKSKGLLSKTVTYMIEYHNFGDVSVLQNFLNNFSSMSFLTRFISKVNRKKEYQDIIILLQPRNNNLHGIY